MKTALAIGGLGLAIMAGFFIALAPMADQALADLEGS